MPKLIRIQSSKTITVTCGLQHQDVTNPDAHIPDRLKVSPFWPKHSIQILRGVGEYPAEIKNWPTVQALVKDNVLTIAAEIDDGTADVTIKTEMVGTVEKQTKKKSLEELSSEE